MDTAGWQWGLCSQDLLSVGSCLASLLHPGKGYSAQSSATSQPPGTSSGEGWLVAHMAQGQAGLEEA